MGGGTIKTPGTLFRTVETSNARGAAALVPGSAEPPDNRTGKHARRTIKSPGTLFRTGTPEPYSGLALIPQFEYAFRHHNGELDSPLTEGLLQYAWLIEEVSV